MKATDLMIGDWVLWEFRPYPIRVDSLTGDINEINNSVAEAFIPIPLTPEILEKNGFRKLDGYNDWMLFASNSPFCGLALRESGNTIRIMKKNYDIYAPCDFVHQLQHALRLCGIEKEIEL